MTVQKKKKEKLNMHNDNSLLHDKVQLREREGWGESEFETQATSAQARRVQLDDVRRQFCLCRRTHYLILLALYAECRTNKSIVCISMLFFFLMSLYMLRFHAAAGEHGRTSSSFL